jgi:starch synthase
MIAMRYGTPPIARRTGGLADSIIDEATSPGAGTGFLFDQPTSEALVAACRVALAVRADGTGDAWRGLVARGMATNFGWEAEAAPRYLEVYRRAIELRRAAIG